MMNSIVEVHPKELKFVVELKKQSSCSIRLTNTTDHHVAFKVKTTSPKKYCVQPNVGVILPKSACEFSVTMQAPKTVPPDMEFRDKFLIQSTVVSSGTMDTDITASTFAKEEGKYVEEKKLRVSLISPADSPILSPIKVHLKQGQGHEAPILSDQVFGIVETLPQHKKVTKDAKLRVVDNEESKLSKDTEVKSTKHVELKLRTEEVLEPAKAVELQVPKYEELKAVKDMVSKPTNAVHIEPAEDVELKPETDVEVKPSVDLLLKLAQGTNAADIEPAEDTELKPAKGMELKSAKNVVLKPSEDFLVKLAKDPDADKAHALEDLNLVKEIEEMKSKLLKLELKLSQAEVTISKLTEESISSIREIKDLKDHLGHLGKGGVQQVEFPVLFGCTVALFSLVLVTAIAIKSLCMKVASSL